MQPKTEHFVLYVLYAQQEHTHHQVRSQAPTVSSTPSTVESHQYYTNSVTCQDYEPRAPVAFPIPGARVSAANPLSWWHNCPHTSVQPVSSVNCMESATHQHHLFRAQNCVYKQTHVCVCASTREPDKVQNWRCCMCFSPVDTEGLKNQAKMPPITQNHSLLFC